jgi:hypothetical protein
MTDPITNQSPPGTYPFTTSAPIIGTYESPTLEFKATVVESPSLFELAKDVSAMANASGGTILVGGRGGNSQLVKYEPIVDDARARNIALSFENAVKDRCSPVPSISVQSIPCPTGKGLLLLIHIPPSIAMVAVKIPANDPAWKGDAWVFFRREAASQNKELRPEMLPMFMTPEIRRIAILLHAIPTGRESKIYVTRRSGKEGGRSTEAECWLEDGGVDEASNCVTFQKEALVQGTAGRTEFRIPLDQINTVFRGQGHNAWHVDVMHYWEDIPLTPEQTRAMFMPRSMTSVPKRRI